MSIKHTGFTSKGTPKHYNFVPNRNSAYNTISQPNSIIYYQISIFPNPNTNKYHIRRFKINNDNKFESVKERFICKKQFDIFMNVKHKHQFKAYPNVCLNSVPYPSNSDISLSRSDILIQENSYSGYSQF